MKTTACLLVLLIAPSHAGTAPPAENADADKKEWISLFNGKSLDGWIPKITATKSARTTATPSASRTAS